MPGMITRSIVIIPKMANAVKIPEKMPAMGPGASGSTSGIHIMTGNNPAFTPNANNTKIIMFYQANTWATSVVEFNVVDKCGERMPY